MALGSLLVPDSDDPESGTELDCLRAKLAIFADGPNVPTLHSHDASAKVFTLVRSVLLKPRPDTDYVNQ
jgi:hypothetical protein